MSFVQAVAVDLDGTLTRDGKVWAPALDALDDCRDRGISTFLVTGRIMPELQREFPGLADRFDVVVTENGAVLSVDGEQLHPIRSVEPDLVAALRDRIDCRSGAAILAGKAADSAVMIEQIDLLGLEYQVVHNRSEAMVLPPGISKGTGLQAALAHVGISARNSVAIGDAENDLSMRETAEIGVAVGNAIDSVRRHADIVLDGTGGPAVADFLRGPIVSGTTAFHPARRALRIGARPDGRPVTVPGAQATVLIRGGSGSGKSLLAGLLMERWITAGYAVLVIDPEGDHATLGRLSGTIVIDAAQDPSVEELMHLITRQDLSVILDLSGIWPDAGRRLLEELAAGLEATRSLSGLPHWVVIDEAHGAVGEGGAIAGIFRPCDGGYCYVTYHPHDLTRAATATVDVTFTTLGPHAADGWSGPEVLCAESGQPEFSFRPDSRATGHVRHRRKYAVSPLPFERSFTFRDPSGMPLRTVSTIEEFSAWLASVPGASIEHHAAHGDFSRWVVSVLQDRELGALVAGAENELTARVSTAVIRLRDKVRRDLRVRYLESGHATRNPAG